MWLQKRGVPEHKAREFLERTGCATEADVAMFLHFHLPPPQFANRDFFNGTMRKLLGVPGAKSHKILQELGIMSACPAISARPLSLSTATAADDKD